MKKCVFNSFLKAGKVSVGSFKFVGRPFQATGPDIENPRRPIVTVFRVELEDLQRQLIEADNDRRGRRAVDKTRIGRVVQRRGDI